MADDFSDQVIPSDEEEFQNEDEVRNEQEAEDMNAEDNDSQGTTPEQTSHPQTSKSDDVVEPSTLQGMVALLSKVIDDKFAAYEARQTAMNRSTKNKKPKEKANKISMITKEKEKEKVAGCSFKTFLSFKPSEFVGNPDPIACMNWLREMEQTFEASECGKHQKVIFASRTMKEKALQWWNVTRTALGESIVSQLTWGMFKGKILEKYCDKRSRHKIEDEFRALEKGNMSVTDYNNLFMEKLGFVEHVAPDEVEKVRYYAKGLPEDMAAAIRHIKAATLIDAMMEAQFMEDGHNREKAKSNLWTGKRTKIEGSFGSSRPPIFSTQGKTQSYSQSNVQPSVARQLCNKCGKAHGGECRAFTDRCFRCGEAGHTRPNCPKSKEVCYECGETGHHRIYCPHRQVKRASFVRPNTGAPKPQNGGVPVAKARAYQIVADDVRGAKDVATGSRGDTLADLSLKAIEKADSV